MKMLMTLHPEQISANSVNQMYTNFRNSFLSEMANKLRIAVQILNLGK